MYAVRFGYRAAWPRAEWGQRMGDGQADRVVAQSRVRVPDRAGVGGAGAGHWPDWPTRSRTAERWKPVPTEAITTYGMTISAKKWDRFTG